MSSGHDESGFHLRDLQTIEDYARVFELEKLVWALQTGDDAVPVNFFAASVKRGAILIGAFDVSGALTGFVYSFPGLKGGRLVQWSHMLGVAPGFQGSGLGYRLKLAQRERAIAQGIDLVEWTFDPLQAGNAHFNFSKLGVVAAEYLRDVYGQSDSPLHKGTPTDRLVAEWHLRDPRVLEKLRETAASAALPTGESIRATGRVSGGGAEIGKVGVAPGEIPVGAVGERAAGARAAPVVNTYETRGPWQVPVGEPDLSCEATTVQVAVPANFTRMLAEAPDMAQAWRLATRSIFEAYFDRGYRATDFVRDAETGGGRYVLRAIMH